MGSDEAGTDGFLGPCSDAGARGFVGGFVGSAGIGSLPETDCRVALLVAFRGRNSKPSSLWIVVFLRFYHIKAC